jgi:hypothetical protein
MERDDLFTRRQAPGDFQFDDETARVFDDGLGSPSRSPGRDSVSR